MKINLKARFKNIMFYIGVISVIFASAGVDFETLTSWRLLIDSVVGILGNPVAVVSVVLAIGSVICDTSTSGFGDHINGK